MWFVYNIHCVGKTCAVCSRPPIWFSNYEAGKFSEVEHSRLAKTALHKFSPLKHFKIYGNNRITYVTKVQMYA